MDMTAGVEIFSVVFLKHRKVRI